MAVRLKDIARDLGVSTVTVSKVLRGNPDIGERTRALVLKRMRELDYQPNMFARALASGRSHAVGLVVPDLVHPFFGEFARALSAALRESGMALLLASSEEDPALERREIRLLQSRGVDVLLVASCLTGGEELPDEGKAPLLLIDRRLPRPGISFVGSDDVRVGELATEHLLALGRRLIAHLGGEGISPALDRRQGYENALRAAGLRVQTTLLRTTPRFEEKGDLSGHAEMQALLRLKTPPDAVFCYNDVLAMGAMQAVTGAGLRIPEDVAFVGCGNLRYSPYLRVPLSSVDHATDRLGAAAAELALRRIREPEAPPETVLLEPRLVVRESSQIPERSSGPEAKPDGQRHFRA